MGLGLGLGLGLGFGFGLGLRLGREEAREQQLRVGRAYGAAEVWQVAHLVRVAVGVGLGLG